MQIGTDRDRERQIESQRETVRDSESQRERERDCIYLSLSSELYSMRHSTWAIYELWNDYTRKPDSKLRRLPQVQPGLRGAGRAYGRTYGHPSGDQFTNSCWTLDGKEPRYFLKINFMFVTAVDLNKRLKQFRLPISLSAKRTYFWFAHSNIRAIDVEKRERKSHN